MRGETVNKSVTRGTTRESRKGGRGKKVLGNGWVFRIRRAVPKSKEKKIEGQTGGSPQPKKWGPERRKKMERK